MRKPHWLRGHKSAAYPRELIVFDTETEPVPVDDSTVEHKLVFGWAAYCRVSHEQSWTDPRWFRFTESIAFWQWVEDTARPKQATYIYCHNANFDWQVTGMCQLLLELGWKCDKAIIEDPPNYFRWRKDKKTLMLLDSTNYWRVKLADIGKRLGIEKLEMPENWNDPETADAYCKRDCEILIVALQTWFNWLAEHELGGLAISLAGQAWSAYLYRFMDYPIFIDDNERALELARDSYYGGRTEANLLSKPIRNVTCCDVNSMYPHVMREYEYPTRLHGIYKRVSLSELRKWTKKYCVTARVIVTTDEPVYPERTKYGLTFPIGTFQTVLSTPEITYALEHDHLVSCSEASVYEKAPIFVRFVDELYAIRKAYIESGDETAKYYVKIMMNSLYGKFGQRSGKEEILGYDDDPRLYVETEIDLDTGKRYRIRHIAGLILSRSLDEEGRDSHPAISAHVTAYARMLLWNLIEQAGRDNVYYTDTDSLHVNAMGLAQLDNLISDTLLGALKVEKHITRAVYFGPKDYRLDGTRTMKGIRANATKIAPATYRQESWQSLRGACATQHIGGPLVRTVTKEYKRKYRKGTVLPDGRVLPLRRVSSKAGAVLDRSGSR